MNYGLAETYRSPFDAKPAGRGAGLYVVARGTGERQASREAARYSSSNDSDPRGREEHLGNHKGRGVKMSSFWDRFRSRPSEDKLEAQAMVIAQQVKAINDIVEEFQQNRSKKSHGLARQDSDS